MKQERKNWLEVLFIWESSGDIIIFFGTINFKRYFVKQSVPLLISSTLPTADKDPQKIRYTPGSLLPFGQ